MNRKAANLTEIMKYFPEKLRLALSGLSSKKAEELYEIRLKSEQPVVLVFSTEKHFVTDSGRVTDFYNSNVLRLSDYELKQVFQRMCSYSVYSMTENICNGFITIENGCRVGVYGTAVVEDSAVVSVRNIKGLNIRLAGDFSDISADVYKLFENSKPSILICGPPLSGKTTLIKDLCRNLSDKFSYKISLIDERAEFVNYYPGFNTDVLTGYPKSVGIMQSVRTLSPEVVVFDELGTSDEAEAVLDGMNSGVSFVMSIHCDNKEELKKKKQLKVLNEMKVIDYFVFLKDRAEVSEIVSAEVFYNEDNGFGYNSDRLCSYGSAYCRFV